ncbi:MAG: CoA-binding protein, partial [Pseudomonadota bacterium]
MERLLRPASIAVIGGGAWGAAVIASARASGFAGPIWPVHPSRAEIGGEACFATLEALPRAPDAAFVAVNRERTLEVVGALAQAGAGGAIAFASGFAEHGAEGEALQARLADLAGDMPVIGPNCYGVINALDGVALWPDRHGLQPVKTGVALVAQSGNILLNLTMQGRGLPIAYAVAAGNQAQMSAAEIGRALLADPRVTALGMYLEGISDLREFEALAAEAEALGKRVVVLKAGRSEAAQAAGQSHTAALSGSAAGAAALFARLGIVAVSSLGAFLQALQLCYGRVALVAPRVAVMSCSGGEAGLAADAADDRGIECPALTEAQEQALSAVLGGRVALANPLDYHTYIWGDEPRLTQMIEAMLRGPAEMGIVILDFPRDDCGASPDWDRVVAAGASARAAVGKPLAILASLPDLMPEWRSEAIRAAGLVPLAGLEDAFEAISAVGRCRAPDVTPVLRPGPLQAVALEPEHLAKAALEQAGLAVPEGRVARSPMVAGEVAAAFDGRVVLKGVGVA